MIVEVDNKQIDSNYFMFDGNTLQVFPTWKDGDSTKDGKMVVNIREDDIEKIIIMIKV